MAIPFTSRHVGYKLGVVLLFVATVMFLVGNFAPRWIQFSITQTNVYTDHGIIYYKHSEGHSSVLAGCLKLKVNGTESGFFYSSESNSCGTGYYHDDDDTSAGGWVHACQAFEVMGTIALLFACVYTVWTNFRKVTPPPPTRYVEIAVLTAGLLEFVSTMVFVGKMLSTVSGSEHYSFAWSLFFAIVASVVVVIDAVVIAIFNRPISEQYERMGGSSISSNVN